MIVVDSNVLAYLYLPSEYSELADRLLVQDPDWIAPTLWRSEFRNVLALYLRKNILSFDQAFAIQSEAESLLADKEYELNSFDVLRLVSTSECSAYDCEFVALAQKLNIQLITMDKKVLKNFPNTAIALTEIAH